MRSGAAVFSTDRDSVIRDWNAECERVTGISAEEAVGRPCWEVVAGHDTDGGIVCHRGCSIARLARQGWPVRSTSLNVRTRYGPKRVTISTIVVQVGPETLILHPLHVATERAPATDTAEQPCLTRRQREVLSLLVEGIRAREIAARLGLSETTVRNHISAVLRELGAHSQLEAVARARALVV